VRGRVRQEFNPEGALLNIRKKQYRFKNRKLAAVIAVKEESNCRRNPMELLTMPI
jgi:hypothetical protein